MLDELQRCDGGLVQKLPREVVTEQLSARGPQDERDNARGAHERCRVAAGEGQRDIGRHNEGHLLPV